MFKKLILSSVILSALSFAGTASANYIGKGCTFITDSQEVTINGRDDVDFGLVENGEQITRALRINYNVPVSQDCPGVKVNLSIVNAREESNGAISNLRLRFLGKDGKMIGDLSPTGTIIIEIVGTADMSKAQGKIVAPFSYDVDFVLEASIQKPPSNNNNAVVTVN